jgi:polyhydroxyalkanoate synthesis regulator phasin
MAKKKRNLPQAGGSDMARKIWLAGIGAYGRAFSEAQESIAKVSEDTTKMFEDLVARGEEIEDTVETKGRELAKRVKAPAFSMEDRIKEMRERLNLSPDGGEGAGRLTQIEDRLAAIEDKLDQLLAAKASRKTSTKKKTTRTL